MEALEFIVAEEQAGSRLDRVLAELCGRSRANVQRWVEAGCVQLNGAPALRASRKVAAGDRLSAAPPAPGAPPGVMPEAIPLDVLYEDEALVVINKPAGLVVHPAPGHPRGTLVNALLHHCRNLAGIGGVLRPGIVHRLDRGTSGVMVAAKSDAAHLALAAQFKEHSIERVYVAFVRGAPQQEAGRSARPIGRHPRDRKRMSVSSRRARSALTHWRVAERFASVPAARLEVRPETGRTHQIRVHLAAEGLPILGDPVYGLRRRTRLPGALQGALQGPAARPALHAARLGFVHPVNGEALAFEAPLPGELAALGEVLREREAAQR